MSGIRSDYIERMIAQLARALATLLGARAKPPEVIEETVADVARRLLGLEYRVLLSADPASTARLLGEALRIEVLARLVEEEAGLLADDAPALAADRRAYALALLELAATLPGPHHPEAAKRREHLTRGPAGA